MDRIRRDLYQRYDLQAPYRDVLIYAAAIQEIGLPPEHIPSNVRSALESPTETAFPVLQEYLEWLIRKYECPEALVRLVQANMSQIPGREKIAGQ